MRFGMPTRQWTSDQEEAAAALRCKSTDGILDAGQETYIQARLSSHGGHRVGYRHPTLLVANMTTVWMHRNQQSMPTGRIPRH